MSLQKPSKISKPRPKRWLWVLSFSLSGLFALAGWNYMTLQDHHYTQNMGTLNQLTTQKNKLQEQQLDVKNTTVNELPESQTYAGALVAYLKDTFQHMPDGANSDLASPAIRETLVNQFNNVDFGHNVPNWSYVGNNMIWAVHPDQTATGYGTITYQTGDTKQQFTISIDMAKHGHTLKLTNLQNEQVMGGENDEKH